MKASKMGQIAVLTSEGHVSILDAMTLTETVAKRKPHTMPITALCFKDEEKEIITAGLDYKYCILPQSTTSVLGFLRDMLLNMGLLLLILFYVAEWIV